MWGVIPAAGNGTRIQPLAFSKELLPVGGRCEALTERPKAVSEYLVDRMVTGGAQKICFVISPGKSDIVEYYGTGRVTDADIAYVVQPRAVGLCDAIFRAAPVIPPDEPVLVGLPDTIWFPEDALRALPDDRLSFLLFPVEEPQYFDAVVMDEDGRVEEIQVKSPVARSNWIWGAFKMPGSVFHELHAFWRARPDPDEYVGTLVNAWLAQGGEAVGIPAGTSYVDVGTLDGYRSAMQLLRPVAAE
ncbi:MAG TPA: nucleotidyltransferase family protein [Allosphingosinicella sp.]|jgi:dTDP-glucose pyrophosphorylase